MMDMLQGLGVTPSRIRTERSTATRPNRPPVATAIASTCLSAT